MRRLLLLPGIILVLLGIYFFLSRDPNTFPQLTSPAGHTGLDPVSIQTNTGPIDIDPGSESGMTLSGTSETAEVTRVVDGDTIQLSTGQTVRYIGIDTPETVHPNKEVQCFGQEASDKNKELVLGKDVKLEKDISKTDKYGRLLRYVWVGDTLVNDYLVRNGFAHASSYPPDIKYQSQFSAAEKYARENNLGLWSPNVCDNASSATSAPSVPDPNCPVKGNISSKGEKIYHMPGQRYYEKTQIDETAGEKYFCSEEEAVKAGWRKSKV